MTSARHVCLDPDVAAVAAVSDAVHEVDASIDALASLVPDEDVNLVGIGRAGVALGAAVAAATGQDFAFVRHTPKDHGTCRQVEGSWHDDRPSVVFVTEHADRIPVADTGLTVDRYLEVSVIPAAATTSQPGSPARRRYRHVDDIRGRARMLSRPEPYVRASGEHASYYFETLEPAHRYDVCASVADGLSDAAGCDAVLGVTWGGVYLASVIAVRHGRRSGLVDTNNLRAVAWPRPPASVLFVDDVVNSGANFGQCRRFAAAYGMDAHYYSLYALRTPTDRWPAGVMYEALLEPPAG
jgi:orotate phosphoribosyltransferase